MDLSEQPLGLLARQRLSPDPTSPRPYQRLNLLLLAFDQHFRRAAAKLQPAAANSRRRTPRTITALRAALQHQITPSCCTQLLQDLAPAYWAAHVAQGMPKCLQGMSPEELEELCSDGVHLGLKNVTGACSLYAPGQQPFDALGEWQPHLMCIMCTASCTYSNALCLMWKCLAVVYPGHCPACLEGW
jgi:hypothetical protein